jgi:putative transposase
MDDELEKTAHKVYKVKYHLVFCIKYRKDLFLISKYVESIKQIFLDMEMRYSIKFETIGFDEDHLHIMIKSLPRYSPSQLFRLIKSISAIQLFKIHEDLKEELWGGEFWSDGGFVGTIGEGINAEIIRKYIKNQGRKGEQLKLFDF